MNSIIVTGASGFIGKRLVKKLTEEYSRQQISCMTHDVPTQMEADACEYLENLGVHFSKVDLVTARGLDASPKNVKIVFHLAASTHTEDRDHSCNDIGTANLMHYLDSVSSPLHIIFTSTMALYDDRENCNDPIDEDHEYLCSPKSEYGRTKLKAEQILKQQCAAKGFGLTIVRLATVYGNGVRSKGMFDSLYRMMQKRSFIPRINWPAKVALVHVDDCIDALCQLSRLTPASDDPQTYVMATENLTLSEISSNIYRVNQNYYQVINLPSSFWNAVSRITRLKKWLENLLPHVVYNKLWQLDLVVTSHMYSHGVKLKSLLPNWGRKKFSDGVYELFK